MMNPILDIFAAAMPTEVQIPGAVAASGDPASAGLFAQAIAEAIGSMPAQVATLSGIITPSTDPTVAPDNGSVKLPEQFLNGIAVQPAAASAVESTTDEALASAAIVSNLVLALAGTESVPTTPTTVAANQDLQKPAPKALNFSRTEGALLSLPTTNTGVTLDRTILQNTVESALTSSNGTSQQPATIQAQVEISDEAATAIASNQVVIKNSDGVPSDLTPVMPRAMQPRSSASLKAQLRREFPAARVESATGKVNIQVKLSDSQPVTTPAQTDASVTGIAAKTLELPIVTANQMAKPIAEIAGKKFAPKLAPKSTRESAAAVKSQPVTIARPTLDNSQELRKQPMGSIRQPVLQALKSQGFDFEKVMSKSGSDAQTMLVGMTEKSAGTQVTEKSALPVFDRTTELNGIERFKLDIKRGHIEALLKKGEIKLQLQPDHLGSLKIKLMTTPTETTARLETSSEDARRAVEASLPALRESFERAGLKLNSVEVVVANDSDSRRQQAFQQEADARNASNKRQALRSAETLPLISEIENTTLAAYGGALNLVA